MPLSHGQHSNLPGSQQLFVPDTQPQQNPYEMEDNHEQEEPVGLEVAVQKRSRKNVADVTSPSRDVEGRLEMQLHLSASCPVFLS